MLTGKAKENFEIWYLKMLRSKPEIQDRYWDENLLSFFWNSDDTIRNAYIIDWFDYFGMPIFVHPNAWNEWAVSIGNTILGGIRFTTGLIQDRATANKIGIEKANEIYNTTH